MFNPPATFVSGAPSSDPPEYRARFDARVNEGGFVLGRGRFGKPRRAGLSRLQPPRSCLPSRPQNAAALEPEEEQAALTGAVRAEMRDRLRAHESFRSLSAFEPFQHTTPPQIAAVRTP